MGRDLRHLVWASACAAAAWAALASTAMAGGLVTGFMDPEQSATQSPSLMVDPSLAYQHVHDAGGNAVRLLLYWRRVASGAEPASPTDPDDPAYDWSQVDQQVKDAKDAGLKVILVFRSAPNWAQGPLPDPEGSYKPAPAKLADFAMAAATRYNGDFDPQGAEGVLPAVRWWEVWNEPNLKAFLKPQFENGKPYSPKLYRSLLNRAAPAIHAVNGANLVLAGNTAPFGNTGNVKPLSFLRKLLCVTEKPVPKAICTGKVQADVFTHHPYTDGNAFHHAVDPDNVSLGDLPEWRRLINAAVKIGHVRRGDTRRKSVGLWATELGWDTNPPDPAGVPTKLHVRWTAEALYQVWRSGLTMGIWTQLQDYPLTNDPAFGAYQTGLYYYDADDNTPKPSLRAFRFPFVAYRANGRISIWGRTPNGLPGTVKIQRKTSSGGWLTKRRVTANANGIFRLSWASTDKRGYYRAVRSAQDISAGFSLVRPPDRVVKPFGSGG